jgi:hypothetical protein
VQHTFSNGEYLRYLSTEHTTANQYQQFELDFEALALNPTDKLEFGIYFLDTSNVKVRNVTLEQQ